MGQPVLDYNGVSQLGVGLHQQTVRDGFRCSAADAFISPLLGNRKNLSYSANAIVRKVILEDKRAVGVEVQDQSGSIRVIKCCKEVILCAGAIGSPQLLQLSGIGPRRNLEAVGISCIADLPVGLFLQDHLNSWLRYLPRNGPKHAIGSVNAMTASGILNKLRLYIFGTGILTSSAYDASVFIRSKLQKPEFSYPDIQLSILCGPGDRFLFETNLKLQVDPDFLPASTLTPDTEGAIILCTLLHPKSYGSVMIRSSDPLEAPHIEAGYLSDPRDLTTLVEAMKLGAALAAKPPLAHSLSAMPQLPLDLMQQFDEKVENGVAGVSDEFWREYIRRYAYTLYHPAGICGYLGCYQFITE